jgi:hypothetical protein
MIDQFEGSVRGVYLRLILYILCPHMNFLFGVTATLLFHPKAFFAASCPGAHHAKAEIELI